jgi:hypothetical protein
MVFVVFSWRSNFDLNLGKTVCYSKSVYSHRSLLFHITVCTQDSAVPIVCGGRKYLFSKKCLNASKDRKGIIRYDFRKNGSASVIL